jgi:putative acetyltransferase
VLIEQRPSDDSEIAALIVDQQVELRARDGDLDGPVSAADPSSRYLVVVMGGDAVACGALQAVDVDTAELKRMYVRPAYRGRGIARRMLTALEDYAALRGHTVVRLESGVYLSEALALYLGAGYRPIPRFGPYTRNEFSRCFEKRLDSSERLVRVLRKPPGDPVVVDLVTAAVDELAARYRDEYVSRNGAGNGGGHGATYPVDPAARFMVATVDGVAAGCGAIQPLDDQTVEIKRMYVRPAHRGNGLARRVLAALEDLAAGAHYPVARLETGYRQVEAISLYESAGYRQIPVYGRYMNNPRSRCYEKQVIAPEAIASGPTER